MAKIKISKEELERDEFMESTDRALLWLKDNARMLGTVIVLGIAVYVAVGFMATRREATLTAANDALSAALDAYQVAIAEHTWGSDERTAAMEDVARMARQVREDFSGSRIAKQARFLEGSAYFSAGDSIEAAVAGGARNTSNAIDVFGQFVAEAEDPFDRGKGGLALGYAWENAFFLTNDQAALGDAIRSFEQVHTDGAVPEFLRAEALLAEARLHAYRGDRDQAIDLYRQVMEMRHEPLRPLPPTAGVGHELVRQIELRTRQFSLAGTARLELQRLGVDVADEYPELAES